MTALPSESRLSLAQPRVPVWVINLALTALLAALWPIDRLMAEYMDPYFLRILVLIGINVILAVSLNLINGITGQFSLGHAGFMAIGAYTTGTIMHYWRPEGAMIPVAIVVLLILGGVFASAAGLVIGIPTLRLRGDYLAIATLGFGEIIYTLIINTEYIGPLRIGGASGLHGIPIVANFFWTYAGVVVCVVCVWRIAYSAKGMAFRAVREDEVAAAAMGIDTTYYKVSAFVIGAFFSGVAGGLFATYQGNLDPAGFRFMRSIEIVVMVVLGGQGSITGSILAAAILTYLPEQLRFLSGVWRMIFYSILLIGMMLLRPGGLLGSRELWWTRRRIEPPGDAVAS
ncbi:branched-chain amino acid ABC transporter permease [Fontivita pretiosa]|uniref:branched-chain amino acid ABC transporter permease n=1 Tax=Fontivita pretiosa TaxID=2989684 RepID=UPI003D178D38